MAARKVTKPEPEAFDPNPKAAEIIEFLAKQNAQLQFQLNMANLSNQKLRLRLEELGAPSED